jgi:small ligand-binding sensory domain FIST
MKFHASVSDHESTDAALDVVVESAREALGDGVDAAFVFFTPHHAEEAQTLIDRLAKDLDPQAVIGCSAEGIIGGDSEIERAPGLALLAARLPGVRVQPFHLDRGDWKPLLTDPAIQLAERFGVGAETKCLIGLGDPFTTPVTQLLPALTRYCPLAPLIGGMASAARQPGDNVLLCNDAVHTEGFVGLSLAGALEVETFVSQGCRPIGRPFVVTKSQENVLFTLGGKRALDALREIVSEMSEDDQKLLGNGLFIGRAISEYRDEFRRNDFLIRNIVGVSEEQGAIGTGDHVRTGQTVQFFVRDARTADEDLAQVLEPQRSNTPAAGALLFSCNGRGTRLFDRPCHDVGVARQFMGQTPIAGFFAAGELGPVGGENFIHGHTASFALFRPIG